MRRPRLLIPRRCPRCDELASKDARAWWLIRGRKVCAECGPELMSLLLVGYLIQAEDAILRRSA